MTLHRRQSLARRLPSALRRAASQLAAAAVQPLRRRPVTGDSPVVVSITSHGDRLRLAWHTIESIAAGDVLPGRVVLWVDDESERQLALRSGPLRRLVSRGLEVQVGEPVGPHGKWWPYVRSVAEHVVPLVTADDDVLYDRDWLRGLVEAYRARPDVIHCHRAHRIGLLPGPAPAPYMDWKPCTDRNPSHALFVTGVSGVIYPPRFLDALRADGDRFRSTTPRNDDVWLTARAVAHGVRIAQVADRPRAYRTVFGGQHVALSRRNGTDGGNDRQIAATFDAGLLGTMESEAGHR